MVKRITNNKLSIPKHVAIIMDGNNRWTVKHKLKGFIGHEKGIEAIQNTIESAIYYKIKYLTLFIFSSENWSRPKKEVSFLMKLLRKYLDEKINQLLKENILIKMIGERKKIPKDILKKIEHCENITKKKNGLNLILALNYGSRNEITIAFNKLMKKYKNKKINIKENNISENLFTKNIPDPDLLIRTSGEKRISNFLLWQLAYTEFVFLDVLWPDFKKKNFTYAINKYSKRKRRYGSR